MKAGDLPQSGLLFNGRGAGRTCSDPRDDRLVGPVGNAAKPVTEGTLADAEPLGNNVVRPPSPTKPDGLFLQALHTIILPYLLCQSNQMAILT